MTAFILMKITESRKEIMFIDGPTFEASCSSSEPRLLKHGYLNNIVRDIIVPKKLLLFRQ
jgi:hypothetical protein